MSISVLTPGLLTTVQDTGRRGHAALGVGHAGAMDTVALRLANCLVRNHETAAALEITLRGPRLRFDDDALVAITGAPISAQCNDAQVPNWRPFAIRAGNELVLGDMRHGARSYLAIAGGIDAECVLGSRSADLNAKIGPRVLAAGDNIRVFDTSLKPYPKLWRKFSQDRANASGARFVASNWSINPAPWFEHAARRPLRALIGSHFANLHPESQHTFFSTDFSLGADSNRIGYRLSGARLKLQTPLELISEGVCAGTVQLPPNGNPIVLMAEAPSCGGYPRIAHIIAVDLPRLAQYRPGDTLRFAETSLDVAQTSLLEREHELAGLAGTIAQRLQEL